jgi:hypothetical protein
MRRIPDHFHAHARDLAWWGLPPRLTVRPALAWPPTWSGVTTFLACSQ